MLYSTAHFNRTTMSRYEQYFNQSGKQIVQG